MRPFGLPTLAIFAASVLAAQVPSRDSARLIEEGRGHFELRCGGCHGGDGRGGERGPDVITTPSARGRTEAQVRDLIRNGLPETGMPGFSLDEDELTALVTFYRAESAPASESAALGSATAGEELFFGKAMCHTCHVRGGGGMVGPDLSSVGARRTLAELERDIADPQSEIVEGYALPIPQFSGGLTNAGRLCQLGGHGQSELRGPDSGKSGSDPISAGVAG